VAADAAGPVRLWQAMGLSLELGEEFKLHESSASVGRVRWTFTTPGRQAEALTVERLAMPDCWLKDPLETWLAEQLPPRHAVVAQGETTFNGHAAQRLLTRAKGNLAAAIRRRQPLRLDVAWLCEPENRLYHVTFSRLSRTEEVELPGSLVVHCCRPVPQVTAAGSDA
jgi:hypothetical protein